MKWVSIVHVRHICVPIEAILTNISGVESFRHHVAWYGFLADVSGSSVLTCISLQHR